MEQQQVVWELDPSPWEEEQQELNIYYSYWEEEQQELNIYYSSWDTVYSCKEPKMRTKPWRDPTWKREYSLSICGISAQTPYFLITIIMLLKAIAQRVALEISLGFIAFGYTYDENSLVLPSNTCKWEDVKNKLNKMRELPD